MPNWGEILLRYRFLLLLFLVGLIVIVLGVFITKSGLLSPSTKVEVLESTTGPLVDKEITVEIAGEVLNPGVYKLAPGARVEDLLTAGGGLTASADRAWTDKYLNRAAKLSDGQKVYIPKIGEQSSVLSAKNGGGDQTVSSLIQSDSNGLVNINSASSSQLDSLPGIGPVYAQNIIEHRPYSDVSELLSKGALKSSVYEKVKELVSVY